MQKEHHYRPLRVKTIKGGLSANTVDNLDKVQKPARPETAGAFRDEDGGCGQDDDVWVATA